jgi:hypothetical protein
MIVVSRDGFVKWAWSSDPAFKSGRFLKTSGPPVEVPALSIVPLNCLMRQVAAIPAKALDR